MYRLALLALTALFLVVSCNSDDSNSNPPENEPANFYALKIGNSWEYEVATYSFVEEEYQIQDLTVTNTIIGDSIINGETYFVFKTTSEGTYECSPCENCFRDEIVRDSLGYLINDHGDILFSNTPTEDYLISPTSWGGIYGKYVGENVEISTPAGDFETTKNEIYGVFSSGETTPSRDSHLIAENIGRIRRTVSLISNEIPLYRMTLKSYSLVDGD
ncbi:hypothetical protein POV27_16210 [Aureisphaera galaxeae]|uniref:hypothetical protein n=1 Tax=Aureisphaera galaxeae TaxID=1538023 RepID=UPI0023501DB7|nr:hypothetical protein [Aureisphaera galaxeae]MDC8005604.1 hypothetical protein [Aureisphaera galaxeae]